ncbi:TatD DNase family protein [Bacteroidales bacterium WCE2004]|jgi:TatD DNase family protein|nr:TatD family hydrolase [Bacteroidales bacterium]SKC42992.1 TatD DNase family protein [Bacteroidales bacterium WCE2004]
MEYIDTHSHAYDEAFAGCEDEVVARGVAAGVTVQLQADIDSHERDRMFALVERHPGVLRPMLGLYPGSVDKDWRREIDALEAWRGRGIVAVGEIGLDYHYGADFKAEQQEAFRVQLELAAAWDLPVNIHLREATEDFFRILEDCRHLHLRGNLHAFGGSVETFERLRRLGDWYVGIGGVVTFKRASVAETVKHIPLERILLETDAPYLTPVPHRGERNESAYIPFIADFIARQKGVSPEEVAAVTTANAKTLFAL